MNKIKNFTRSFSTATRTATLFPGDGIGPEISGAVQQIFKAANVPIDWEYQSINHKDVDKRTNSFITVENLESVKRNGIGLKGPMTTPIGKGFRSLNLTLRKELDLYANVRPCFNIPGVNTRHKDVNIVTIRENTEGEYSGLEHEVVPGVVESLKIITRKASERVGRYAFQYARDNNRREVTAVHKANIMKHADGLFRDSVRKVREEYPDIQYSEMNVDIACMKLVQDPTQFDMMVMPNLYGDIISDLCAGLVGGLGVTPSGNIGLKGLALMEAVHGTAPDIAGKNMANPTAIILSSILMLRHLGLREPAEQIEKAVFSVLNEGKFVTGDLGGKSTTTEYTQEICNRI